MERKRALVTGGSRGIGKGISLMLARNGFDVIINYRGNKEAAEATKKEVEDLGVNCTLLQFDIADFEKTKTTIEKELQDNGAIDVLIVNAGTTADSLLVQMKEEQWENVIDVNLKSFYYITRPIVEKMFANKWGKIVVISSTGGLTGMPGQVNYCASKFGIIGAAKSLAVEMGRRNINVNIIAPGYIDTELISDMREHFNEIKKQVPMRRIGTIEDIANVTEFLISEKASYIQGQVIAVNGGVLT